MGKDLNKPTKIDILFKDFCKRIDGKQMHSEDALKKIFLESLNETNIELRGSRKKKKVLTMDMLFTGVRVKFANDEWGIVYRDKCFLTNPAYQSNKAKMIDGIIVIPKTNGWMDLSERRLKQNDGYKIVEVYNPTEFFCYLNDITRIGSRIY